MYKVLEKPTVTQTAKKPLALITETDAVWDARCCDARYPFACVVSYSISIIGGVQKQKLTFSKELDTSTNYCANVRCLLRYALNLQFSFTSAQTEYLHLTSVLILSLYLQTRLPR
jgi:hypothetical protein